MDDDLVAAIRRTAADLRREAGKVALSHQRMDEIAGRLDALVARTDAAKPEEEER